MDNVTHTMTGVLLARAGLNRVVPRATLALVLASNGPDIDAISAAWGSLSYLRHHRGFTHALIGIPLVAALVVVVMRLVSARSGARFSWLRNYGVALAGVALHVLMDFTNVYGLRPLWPFSLDWYSWDISHLVDVWLSVAMLAALAAPGLGRLISGEIGARPGSGRAAALLALSFMPAWWGARHLTHGRAVAMLEAYSYGGETGASAPLRTAAFPSSVNPLVWRGYVETEQFHQMLSVDVRMPLDPTRGQIYYKPEITAPLEAALRTRTASQFASFARYRIDLVDRLEQGYRVVFTDLRFQSERRNAFVCTVVLNDDLRVISEGFSF